MASSLSTSDMAKAASPEPITSPDMGDDDDMNITTFDTETKVMQIAKNPGTYALITKVDGKVVGSEIIPPQYLEFARKHPAVALEKIRAEKQVPAQDPMMEAIRRDIDAEIKKNKNR